MNENYEAAMACYVNVLITGTEYCTSNLQRALMDEHIVRRMIKCCLNLGCNMQAAILCQVLKKRFFFTHSIKTIPNKVYFFYSVPTHVPTT